MPAEKQNTVTFGRSGIITLHYNQDPSRHRLGRTRELLEMVLDASRPAMEEMLGGLATQAELISKEIAAEVHFLLVSFGCRDFALQEAERDAAGFLSICRCRFHSVDGFPSRQLKKRRLNHVSCRHLKGISLCNQILSSPFYRLGRQRYLSSTAMFHQEGDEGWRMRAVLL